MTAPSIGGWWRSVAVVLCLVLLAVTAPLAVVATWARDQVGDTDRYVETIAPLADDPTVQAAVADRLTAEIVGRLEVPAAIEALGLPLATGIEGFVARHVDAFVRSDEFATGWVRANREAHAQLVALLTGDPDSALQLEDDAVHLDLAVLVRAVQDRLVASGFTLADRLPSVRATMVLVQSPDVARAQRGFDLLSTLARVLPVASVLLLAAAVLIARRRRRVLVAGCLVVAGSMLALGMALDAFRVVYLDSVPAARLPADAAGAVYDVLVRFMRYTLRSVLLVALVVAAVAWLVGSPVGGLLGRYRGPVRAAVLVPAVVLVAMSEHPSRAWTITVVAATASVLLLVEVLARAGPPAEVPQ
ncbi:hypothetical protein [Nocardioides sp. W7]|uniref:hypothetical protein n=1 Tax=Nocardioides sp. W7 TaxID=2931390 RepID=UPI001FD32349|nr:hypothetical protein [Nocardioides sp. W7]